MTKLSTEALSRAADLHYVYQHGEDAAKGDATAEPEFKQQYADDAEAVREYQRGFAEQQGRQFGLSNTRH